MAGADWYGCGAAAGAGASTAGWAGAAGFSASISSSISETERPDCQAALTALPVSLKLPPSVGIGAETAGASGTAGTAAEAGVPSGAASAAICAARSAGERTIVSPCTRPVISSCGSSTGIGSGSSSTGMRGVSNLGSCGTGVSGVSNSVGCGRSSVVSALTSCGV